MNYYDSKYRDEVNGIISDIFYVPTSNDNKISTIRRYAEIIVRRLADWDMDEAITLGDKNVIEKLKKKGVNEQMFWAAYNTIRTCGNNRTHTQVTTTATDQEYNLVVDRLLDLYAYLFVDFFKRYRFGNNPNILTSFSILPPIIRYKALLELYNHDPNNTQIIEKLTMAIFKAFNKNEAVDWIEKHKEVLEQLHFEFQSSTEEQDQLVNRMGRINAGVIKQLIAVQQKRTMYDICMEKINCLVESDWRPLYDSLETAIAYYKENGIVPGDSDEVREFNSLMEFIYMGRKADANIL